MSLAVHWRKMAEGGQSGLLWQFTRIVLFLPALGYGLLLWLRAIMYQYSLFKSHSLPCPVISIGNLTVGGTGKTPVTAWIARLLIQQGKRVAVLSRGYGGQLQGRPTVVSDGQNILCTAKEAGDEPYLLASSVPGLMVVVGADRYQAGLLALEKLKPAVILLDDGFQHIRLKRDLNILLLDAAKPFGNGFTLPLGLLREPTRAMKRADFVIYTRHRPDLQVADPGLPYCCTRHQLTSFRRLDNGTELSCDTLKQARIAAFAGIARPQDFFDGLQQLGLTVTTTLALPDHAQYNSAQLAELEELVQASSPDWLVTTEKDGVKLAGLQLAWKDRLLTARLELQMLDNGQQLSGQLSRTI